MNIKLNNWKDKWTLNKYPILTFMHKMKRLERKLKQFSHTIVDDTLNAFKTM